MNIDAKLFNKILTSKCGFFISLKILKIAALRSLPAKYDI